MIFHILTIFPQMFDSYLSESILARAIESKKIGVKLYNIRDYTKDRHKKVDGIPYGGGPGMVMNVQPIVSTVDSILKKLKKNLTTLLLFVGDMKELIIASQRY